MSLQGFGDAVQMTVEPVACTRSAEAVNEMAEHIGTIVEDVLREHCQRFWVVRLDLAMVPTDPISAKHHKPGSEILSRVLEHMVQR